jgi:hypothetical protein
MKSYLIISLGALASISDALNLVAPQEPTPRYIAFDLIRGSPDPEILQKRGNNIPPNHLTEYLVLKPSLNLLALLLIIFTEWIPLHFERLYWDPSSIYKPWA